MAIDENDVWIVYSIGTAELIFSGLPVQDVGLNYSIILQILVAVGSSQSIHFVCFLIYAFH